MTRATSHRNRRAARRCRSHTATAVRRCPRSRPAARESPPRARATRPLRCPRETRRTARGRPRELRSASCADYAAHMTTQRSSNACHRDLLTELAHQAMIDKGLEPDFTPEIDQQLSTIFAAADENDSSIRDLRNLLWCSIDNDDSKDLDQLTVAEDLGGGRVKLCVAVADVDTLVKKATAIDDHARHNTTSVYTAGGIFPMLPVKLSTDLTSLNEDV